MSKFTTHIPVAVEDVIKTLPKGSHVNGWRISEDKRSFVVEWENDNWRTPYTMAVEVTPAQLVGEEQMAAFIKREKTPAEAGTPNSECKKVQTPTVASAKKTGVKAKGAKTTGQPVAPTGGEPGCAEGQS